MPVSSFFFSLWILLTAGEAGKAGGGVFVGEDKDKDKDEDEELFSRLGLGFFSGTDRFFVGLFFDPFGLPPSFPLSLEASLLLLAFCISSSALF